MIKNNNLNSDSIKILEKACMCDKCRKNNENLYNDNSIYLPKKIRDKIKFLKNNNLRRRNDFDLKRNSCKKKCC